MTENSIYGIMNFSSFLGALSSISPTAILLCKWDIIRKNNGWLIKETVFAF